MGYNDIRDSQGNYIDLDKANEIVEALNFPDIRWVQVGHYTNMLNSKYNVTGTAWIEGKLQMDIVEIQIRCSIVWILLVYLQ